MKSATMIVCATGLALIGTGGSALAQQPNAIHYQCYQLTRQQQKKLPPAVHVLDQFNRPNGENARLVGPPLFLCAPAIKNKEGEVDLNGPHLLCYRDRGMKTPNKPVTIDNQFGPGSLVVGAPALLCVPTTKKLLG
jgi:hypothetical protein